MFAASTMTLLLFLSGCISVPKPVRLVPSVPADQSGKIGEKAIASLSEATDADKVREAILVMESALESNTDDIDIAVKNGPPRFIVLHEVCCFVALGFRSKAAVIR